MQNNKKGSRFTFDSFEVTKENSKAFEKAKQFAENADSKSLALFGGTATGKTHLLYAVKNAIEQNSPELHVILTTTTDMVSYLTNIINSGGTAEQFREKYLQADVLLVDDIQDLAGKEKTQNVLILLFNAFYESSKRFMMTSSQKESHFGIKDRLLIRSFWGEFAVISKPYINAQLSSDNEQDKRRDELIEEGTCLHDNFDIDSFKTYYKNIWLFFRRYVGLFDVKRKDIKLIIILNDLKNELDRFDIPHLKKWEQWTCSLFIDAMLNTISSLDYQGYKGGFCNRGVLCLTPPIHSLHNTDEITINEFDERFQSYCKEIFESYYEDDEDF
ncbi:dnaA protein [Ruminococcus sp. YRD2003]|uniref:DnaA ATPase domain-containing protein n=1 Tax=Ruminococcus sp. YRD2003 TaxID=1452313 RepID=UPI0008CEE075|nr:dnaA protein [Ruminococcus flavefaciens]